MHQVLKNLLLKRLNIVFKKGFMTMGCELPGIQCDHGDAENLTHLSKYVILINRFSGKEIMTLPKRPK